MDEQRRIAELEQALRDERDERDAAQRRVGELLERSDLWRTRAEERTERIDMLVAERNALRTARGWIRSKLNRPIVRISEPAAPPVRDSDVQMASRPKSGPSIPVVRVAALVDDPHLARVFAETDCQDIGERSLAEADVVVVDLGALVKADRPLVDSVEAWASLDARQPLVVVGEVGSPLVEAAELVITPGEIVTFDPKIHNPMVGSHMSEESRRSLDPVAAAASGTPQRDATHAESGTGPLRDRTAVRARRAAYRDYAPSVVASRLLDQAGVPHPKPHVRIAGLLVSMRPDDVIVAIERFLSQDYSAKELVVVCHGFDPGPARAALESEAIPFEVLDLPSHHPLGTGLNVAAEATSASILAKIDDDDHYGPGYLTDAVDALLYSSADVVGKATHYTYFQASDTTVLRRAGLEERFVDGSVAGGSMAFRRRIWEDVRFPIRPRRVDALFLRGARTLDAAVYANSRWDFVYRRRAEDQTWRVGDEALLAGTQPAWEGDHPERTDA